MLVSACKPFARGGVSVVSRSASSTIGLDLQAVLLITMWALHPRELFLLPNQVCQRPLLYWWRCSCSSFTLQRYRKFLNQQVFSETFFLLFCNSLVFSVKNFALGWLLVLFVVLCLGVLAGAFLNV